MSVSSSTLDALGACVRTLAEAPDAGWSLPEAPAVSLGAVRAAADRSALRRRFVDEAIERRHRPTDDGSAAAFDALSRARIDALGARWLAGIRSNLLSHPGAGDEALRWLAFEAFAGLAAPQEKAAAVARTRAALPAHAVAALAALAAAIDNHERFAAAAAAWVHEVVPHLPPEVKPAPGERFSIPRRPAGTDIRRGRYARPGATPRPPTQPASSDEHAAAAASSDPVTALTGYRAYTTAFDRTVNAVALARRDELAELRRRLDADFSSIRSTVARLAKRLMRVLMAQQVREWRFDRDEGLLDSSRLAPFVASRGAARPFKEETASPFPSTVVTLLIDHSGSMRGRPMQIAALTVEIFARVLERCGVRCEVLGFTTREWDGGEPARQWAADGYPDRPGRLNALEHIVIKAADVPWRRARIALGLFLHDEMLKENIDGEALQWAHARLLARPERRRILVVISDGTPMDEATFAANGFDYLDGHLAAVVDDIETRSQIQLAAIGIGHDVSRFYRNATRISRIDDLGPALTEKLIGLLGG
jgi:cobaltochelatase CobT